MIVRTSARLFGVTPDLCSKPTATEGESASRIFVMTDVEIKELARRLLYDVLSDPANADTFGNVFTALTLDDDGEPVPMYSGEDKAGGFECYFWPLPGAEEIVKRCVETYDGFVMHDPDGLHKLADLWQPEDRAEAIESMARVGIFRLLLNIRAKLTAAFDLNVDECELVAGSMLAATALEWVGRLGLRSRADAAPEVKKLSARVETEEVEHLRWMLRSVPLIQLGRKRGPKALEEADIVRALQALGPKASAANVAAHLQREQKAVFRWAEASQWGKWSKAKRALLERAKKHPN
jgi:hypothetical protein